MQRPLLASASLWTVLGLVYPPVPAAGLPRFQDTGELRGLVVDARSSQPLAGIEVSFVQIDFSALTDSSGRYAITNIPPGRYTLLVKGEGFKPAVASRHVLRAATVNVLDFELEPLDEWLEPPAAEGTPDYWSEVIPGSALRANTDLVQALRGSVRGSRFDQVTAVPISPARAQPRPLGLTDQEPSFLWVIDGRAVARPRSLVTSDVLCVEIRRGAAAVQRFARSNFTVSGGEDYQGVVLVWTRGSRAPMPEACQQP